MGYSNCGTTTKSTARKTSNSYEVTTDDILRAASAAARKPLGPSVRQHLRALGTEDVYTAPSQTSALSLRAAEEWERCICENQAFSILHQAQEGRQELIKKIVEKASVNRPGSTA